MNSFGSIVKKFILTNRSFTNLFSNAIDNATYINSINPVFNSNPHQRSKTTLFDP